jgi:iron complex outermembrane receptor protein
MLYVYGLFSQPVTKGPALISGLSHQLYVPVTNPYTQEFAQRTGWANNPLYPLTQGFTANTWRAFAHGGLDLFAHGDNNSTPRRIDNRYLHASTGLEGEFANEIFYDFGLTYNQTHARNTNPDILLYRVQEALNGFGGPNCNARDLNPNRLGTQNPALAGVGDCMWFNPFATNFAGQPVLGLNNPNYDPSAQNPDELIRWFFNDRYQESVSWNVTADMVFSGMTGLELGGGNVAWAVGSQWRQTKLRQTVPDPFYNGSVPCQWPAEFGQVPLPPEDPNYRGCTPDEPGPFQFFDTNEPSQTSQDQVSVFGELNIPILDNLYTTAAVRYERFTGGLDSTVYKLSGKWDATDSLAFRTSYGTNYQAPGAGITPGNISSGTVSFNRAGGAWRGSQTFTRSDIEPEEATVWSAGAIWQSEGFTPGSDLQVIVDYFSIETENELGLLASTNQIANAVFSIPPSGSGPVPNNGSALADCSHPLVNRVTFNGDCIQGVTTANDFAIIRSDYGNGPGQSTAGYDLQLRYNMPAFAGDLRLSATATYISKFEYTETVLDGYILDPGADRRGFLNFATIANAVSKVRGNFSTNYSQGDHNFRLVFNYISGVDDDRFFNDDGSVVGAAALTPAGLQPGTSDPFGPSMFGVRGKDWVTADFHYVVDLPWATLNASIVNLADKLPPASRQELGYDPRIGNPMGRTFQVGLRKTF